MTDSRPSRQPVTLVLAEADEQPHDSNAEDRWLESSVNGDTTRTISGRLKDSVSLPALWLQKSRNFSATTLGMMTLICLGLTIAILAAGISMSQTTERRQDQLAELSTGAEPMSAAAQDLFTSLSLADTIAATGFVQAGVEQPSTRERYQRAIQRSSSAATLTAAGLGNDSDRELELINQIQTHLPIYTGLVETARTNNRLGNPVGVAYMSEASSLMRATLLPAAGELLDISNNKLNEQQQRLTRPLWIPISGLLGSLVLLYLAQRWLAEKTRRRLNKGFIVSTALMLSATLWVGVASGLTWYSGQKGYAEASAPLGALTDARILAQEARTAETLTLVRRETSVETIEKFDLFMTKVHESMAIYEQSPLIKRGNNRAEADNINAALANWKYTHESLRRALDKGEYNSAIDLTFHQHHTNGQPTEGTTTAAAFDAVDSGLAKLMQDARVSLRAYLNSSLAASRWLSTLVLAISVAAIAAIWIGIRPRLQEYM